MASLVFGAAPAQAGLSPLVQASHVEDNGGVDIGGGVTSYEFAVFNDGQSGGDEYGFFVEPIIVDWELPYFDDPGAIFNVRSPDGWTFSIEQIGVPNGNTGWAGVADWQNPADPFYFGADSPFTTVTQVLHWYVDPLSEEEDPVSVFGIHTADSFECGYAAFQVEALVVEGPLPCNALAGFGFDSMYPATAAPYQASWDQLPIQTGDPAFPLAGLPASPSVTQTNDIPEPATGILLGTGVIALGGWFGRKRRQKS